MLRNMPSKSWKRRIINPKTKLCQHYTLHGKCPNGNLCQNIHHSYEYTTLNFSIKF